MSDETRYETLVVRAVDGLLSDDETQELAQLLASSEARRAEHEAFMSLKLTTDAMASRIRGSAEISPPRETVGARRGLRAGFGLLFVGILALLGIGGYRLVLDPSLGLPEKMALGAVVVGACVLFLHALATRWRGGAKDPYKEVDR